MTRRVAEVDQVYAARGARVRHFLVTEGDVSEELLRAVVGPTGNLRAPTLRLGSTLVVGFNPELYETVLSSDRPPRSG